MTRLITFATDNMSIAAQICRESALQNNVHEVKVYGLKDIDKKFLDKNKTVFDQPRGFGYWLWKPYLIDRELKRMNEGDILIYCDAGVEIINNVNHICDRMQSDVWLFGNMFKHVHWCKADAWLPYLGEHAYNSEARQVQASVLFIRNTDVSRAFVKEWLMLCQQPGLIDDSDSKEKNHPEFQEHRHDQAILTTLAFVHKLDPFHWWPATYNAGNFTYDKTGYSDSYPVIFHHHRMRNEQFEATDELSRRLQNYFKPKYKLA